METHSVLAAAGSDASAVAQLWWAFLAVTTVVYVLVVGALWLAIRRARRRAAVAEADEQRIDARSRTMVGVAVAATVVVLLGLLTADFLVGHAVLGERQPAGEPVRIRITAQQFWWQVEYEDAVPSQRVLTANELVVPVGRPLELELRSRDVIHSFWLPSVAGKKDLIPGITNTLRFSVLRPGRYEGRCAEFCGYQHANMRTAMTAVDPQAFEAWKAQQRTPGREPQTALEQRGREVFEHSTCVLCHAVQGTGASASIGPDLTHFGSRRWIAATALPNTHGHRVDWIADPQKIKPGTNMPATLLPARDLDALSAYLCSLQ